MDTSVTPVTYNNDASNNSSINIDPTSMLQGPLTKKTLTQKRMPQSNNKGAQAQSFNAKRRTTKLKKEPKSRSQQPSINVSQNEDPNELQLSEASGSVASLGMPSPRRSQQVELPTNSQLKESLTLRFGPDSVVNGKQSNRVRTTKYTALSWFPLSILFQFGRAANIYFLVISVLTTMSFSPKSPQSMIGTFLMVLLATSIKEAYEDFQRYKSDKEMNQRITTVVQNGQEVQTKWSQVKVGQIIKVNKDEEIPADLLIISAPKDIVYVSTMNLDGETNLKDRELVVTIQEDKLGTFAGQIVCDKANSSIDHWEGTLSSSDIGKIKPCSIKNLLLRGTSLRNTPYVYGLVVYVGTQTKIFMNSKKAPRKVSNLMRKMNYMLYTVFAFQLVIIAVFATFSILWMQENQGTHSYLDIQDSNLGAERWFTQLLTYWVSYSHMIPISLYVVIELVKLGQAKLINKDVKMYWEEDQKFALCRNSDLVEELGQVEFVFSDKTGTLTQNKMEFKKSQVAGKVYGNQNMQDKSTPIEGMCASSINYIREEISKSSPIFANRLVYKATGSCLYQFFRLLAVCHTVVVDIDPDTNELAYQATSPDELALIQGAKQAGMVLAEKSATTMTIMNENTQEKELYEILAEFPFDSTRKRMSLLVRHHVEGKDQILLLCKGADSIVLPRCMFNNPMLQEQRTVIMQDLLDFAKDGLRTLVVGQKTISESEYQKFDERFQQIKISVSKNKEQLLNDLYDSLETNLTYIGSTAIEDKLQNQVPQTIAKLIEAQIRVWVLTGDKQETAIEIGKSCQLIQESMDLIDLSSPSEDEFKTKLLQNIKKFNVDLGRRYNSLAEVSKLTQGRKRISIVIDGPTLLWALADETAADAFFSFGLLASSVVCCRVSPKQKADVVALAKRNGKWITLSIGDGANDVPMIMEAHIGVGVRGKEGTQAVRSGDYAVSQFSYLHRLLLVHGRWGYRRISWLVCYYFYKNIVLVFTEIFFATENGFSGQIFFADWLPMLYNAVWTSWQCMFAYSIEQDVNDQYTYKYPKIYSAGQQGVYFSFRIFWRWIIFAVWHGVTAYFGVIYGLQGPIDLTGRTYQHWFTSTVAFTLIIHIIVFKLFLETVFWNWISGSTGVLCLLIYYGTVYLGNTAPAAGIFQKEIIGEFDLFLSSAKAWIVLMVLTAIALLPDTLYLVTQKVFWPTPTDVIMLKQQRNPDYVYDGFDEYQMPTKKEPKNISVKSKSIKPLDQMEMNEHDDYDDYRNNN